MNKVNNKETLYVVLDGEKLVSKHAFDTLNSAIDHAVDLIESGHIRENRYSIAEVELKEEEEEILRSAVLFMYSRQIDTPEISLFTQLDEEVVDRIVYDAELQAIEVLRQQKWDAANIAEILALEEDYVEELLSSVK